MISSEPKIAETTATAFTIPTDAPEADGTFAWDSTTMIVVEMKCERATGVGYTYSHKTAAPFARELMKKHVEGYEPVRHERACSPRCARRSATMGATGLRRLRSRRLILRCGT